MTTPGKRELTHLLVTQALVQGDRGACRIVIRRLFEWSAFRIKDRAAWDDVVEETLVTMHESLMRAAVPEDVDSWAKSIHRDKTIDHLSTRARAAAPVKGIRRDKTIDHLSTRARATAPGKRRG